MFGKVLASAAIVFALVTPATGTASANWEKNFYQDCFEYFMKQYDIKIHYKSPEKTVEKETESSAAPAPSESPADTQAVQPEQPAEENKAAEPVAQPEEVTVAEPAPQPEEVKEPETVSETPDSEHPQELGSFEAQVIELTNQERSKAGLPALSADVELSAVAEEKSADMARNQYFSHTSPTYGSPFDMMKSYGINYRSAGENIAMGQQTPQQVVDAWMNSEGHRQNILSTSYTHIGVGYVENGNYWTQMFIDK
ncbi:hypothetical protein KP77_20610 [Jeotgalibacillus alimentarius]|uniref:SCP domain-containing protein n=1 Tax=Jeotgalibacillus alimentarius TaxID=135826 RepID=A0A0C2RF79_9BACL|nr:CAP domain-containing protein [Jeotgalibacillus alimentarius]KIL48850.1 hypothetical protein KP77_20610 [Jeotgalibacillus alimentarius]